ELEARNAELQRKVELLMAQMRQQAPAGGAQQAASSHMTRTAAGEPVSKAAPSPRAAAAMTAASPAPATPDLATLHEQVEAEAEDGSWWRRAPKLSQNERGLAEHSEGNFVQAARHFTRGVRAGDADAMNNLGMLLLQGQGVEMDRE